MAKYTPPTKKISASAGVPDPPILNTIYIFLAVAVALENASQRQRTGTRQVEWNKEFAA
jgi:hypothetical protein